MPKDKGAFFRAGALQETSFPAILNGVKMIFGNDSFFTCI
jgi:hypothetical protein